MPTLVRSAGTSLGSFPSQTFISAAGPGGLPNKIHIGTLGFLVAQAEGETDPQLEQIIVVLPVQMGFGLVDAS